VNQTRFSKFVIGGLFLIVALIVLYPVLMLLYGSVRSSALEIGAFSRCKTLLTLTAIGRPTGFF
jgi:hypothetical protein